MEKQKLKNGIGIALLLLSALSAVLVVYLWISFAAFLEVPRTEQEDPVAVMGVLLAAYTVAAGFLMAVPMCGLFGLLVSAAAAFLVKGRLLKCPAFAGMALHILLFVLFAVQYNEYLLAFIS